MALRSIVRRLGAARAPSSPSSLLSRATYSSSGRVLDEEEKAAENIYIKKSEMEKLEKLARKGLELEEKARTDAQAGETFTQARDPKPSGGNSNTTLYVTAGVVAVAAGSWWLGRSSAKGKEKSKG